MKIIAGCEKAAVTLLIGVGTWFSTAFADGKISTTEWCELAGALAAAAATYLIPNSGSPSD